MKYKSGILKNSFFFFKSPNTAQKRYKSSFFHFHPTYSAFTFSVLACTGTSNKNIETGRYKTNWLRNIAKEVVKKKKTHEE